MNSQPRTVSDADDERLNDWCMDSGSVVEMWGGEELRAKILDILDSGGDIKSIFVDAPVNGFNRSMGDEENSEDLAVLRAQLGTAIAGDNDSRFPVDPAMLRLALRRVDKWVKRGYEVVGYCDNIDQAEIIVAKVAADSVGSADPNDVLIDLWKKAKATPAGPEQDKLMVQVQKMQAKLSSESLVQQRLKEAEDPKWTRWVQSMVGTVIDYMEVDSEPPQQVIDIGEAYDVIKTSFRADSPSDDMFQKAASQALAILKQRGKVR